MKTRQSIVAGFIPIALCFTFLSCASASTIFWGSRQNDVIVDSNGVNLGANFQFEIGYFDTSSGWAPTILNISEWEARWIVFDKASFGNGWDPTNREINTSVNHTVFSGSDSPFADPSSVFTQGATVYLWVYDSKSLLGNAEWALLCDSDKGANVFQGAWEFPNPIEQNGESYDWQTRDLDTAILGGVNGTQGPGGYLVDPGVFTIQTHAVPEPGSVALLITSGLLVIRRRRLGVTLAR